MRGPHYVMGLDGSLANFGIAVALVSGDGKEVMSVEHLIISKTTPAPKKAKVKRADDDFARFKQHWQNVTGVAKEYKVETMYAEIPSGAQDARASFAFGGVTAMLAGLSIDYDVTTVTPAQVKIAATGDKHADKEEMIGAMYGLFPDAPWLISKKPNAMSIVTKDGYLTNANEHLADSVGVILAGIEKQKK